MYLAQTFSFLLALIEGGAMVHCLLTFWSLWYLDFAALIHQTWLGFNILHSSIQTSVIFHRCVFNPTILSGNNFDSSLQVFTRLFHFVNVRCVLVASHCSHCTVQNLLSLHAEIIVSAHEFVRVINILIWFFQFTFIHFWSLRFIRRRILLCLCVVVNMELQVLVALFPWPVLGAWGFCLFHFYCYICVRGFCAQISVLLVRWAFLFLLLVVG